MAFQKVILTSVVLSCFYLGGVAYAFPEGGGAKLEHKPLTQVLANDTTTQHSTSGHENVTTASNLTTHEITTSNLTTHEITTTNLTTHETTTTNLTTHEVTTAATLNTTHPEVTTSNHTTEATTASNVTVTTERSTTQGPTSTTTQAPHTSPKFDIASFFGGMAAAVVVVVLVFLIWKCYSHTKKNRYHAM